MPPRDRPASLEKLTVPQPVADEEPIETVEEIADINGELFYFCGAPTGVLDFRGFKLAFDGHGYGAATRGDAKAARDPNSRINKSLRKWDCG